MDLIDAIRAIDKPHEDDVMARLYTVWGEKLDETIKAIKAIHPYEEPVINVIELYRPGL